METPCLAAMKPSTEKMTKPDRRLVKLFIPANIRQSLEVTLIFCVIWCYYKKYIIEEYSEVCIYFYRCLYYLYIVDR